MGLRQGESVRFSIRGRCMRALSDGTSVLVRRQRVYVPGDVLVVRRAERWSAHRFLGYAPTRAGLAVLTQADDSMLADPPALWPQVVGRAECDVTTRDRVRALHGYARAVLRRVFRSTR